jgi:hypothetical protein
MKLFCGTYHLHRTSLSNALHIKRLLCSQWLLGLRFCDGKMSGRVNFCSENPISLQESRRAPLTVLVNRRLHEKELETFIIEIEFNRQTNLWVECGAAIYECFCEVVRWRSSHMSVAYLPSKVTFVIWCFKDVCQPCTKGSSSELQFPRLIGKNFVLLQDNTPLHVTKTIKDAGRVFGVTTPASRKPPYFFISRIVLEEDRTKF